MGGTPYNKRMGMIIVSVRDGPLLLLLLLLFVFFFFLGGGGGAGGLKHYEINCFCRAVNTKVNCLQAR